jgi:hypothetical protein
MKYELAVIDSLIRNLSSDDPAHSSEEYSEKMLTMFRDEILRIKSDWKNNVFAADDERKIELYIQHHQKELIELADLLLEYRGGNGTPDADSGASDPGKYLYENFYIGIEELLAFIENYFSRYFDQNHFIPVSYKWVAHHDFKVKVTLIRKSLEKRKVDKHLVSLAFFPLDRFINETAKCDITFRRLIYLKKFIRELQKIAEAQMDDRQINEELRKLFFYLNYNSLRVFNYATGYISKFVSMGNAPVSKYERLALVHKLINQTQVKPGFSFDPNLKSINEQLAGWIAEEISFYEKKQLTLEFKSNGVESAGNEYKLKTDLSVPQMAFFIRLMMESKVIRSDNIQEVLRFCSRHLQSRRTEKIAHASLYSKFYNTEQSTLVAVKEILTRMLNLVNKKLNI